MRTRPKDPPCICCARHADDAGTMGYQLFQPNQSKPCAWAHQDCFVQYAQRRARMTLTGIDLGQACILCELHIPAEELHPLHGENTPAVAWVHAKCMADYE
jgi:hypothetical protein